MTISEILMDLKEERGHLERTERLLGWISVSFWAKVKNIEHDNVSWYWGHFFKRLWDVYNMSTRSLYHLDSFGTPIGWLARAYQFTKLKP